MRRLIGFCLAGLVLCLGAVQSQEEKSFDHPFYPLQVGHKWIYRAGAEKVTVEVVKKEPFVRKVKGAGGKETTLTLAGYVLNVSSGNKVLQEHVAVLEDGVYRLSAAGKAIQPPLCYFKLPLKTGESWACQSTTEDTVIKGNFVGGEATVKVPFRDTEIKAMTVSSKDFQVGNQTMEVDYFFAPQVGMIKQRVKINNQETILELEKFLPAK